MSAPEKVWTEVKGYTCDGLQCVWQGLVAALFQRHNSKLWYLNIQTERALVTRRATIKENASQVPDYLVKGLSFEDPHKGQEAAEAILDLARPVDIICCPTCGREKL